MYIPTQNWAPGVYALKCTASGTGQVTYIPFTVKPAVGSESGKIALLVNVNTWNAYSTYGGVSNYPTYPPTAASTERNYIDTPGRLSLERPYTSDGKQLNQTTPVQFDQLLRGEWWILDWLQKNYPGQVDVYTDLDLHDGSLDLSKYKVLVLSTHPEYWPDAEYNNTQHFLATGGSLLYLGGNGIYRRCVYEASSRTIIYLQDAFFQYPGSAARPDSTLSTGWQCVDVLPPGSGSVRGSRSEVYLLGVGGYINCPGAAAGLAYTVVTSGDPLLQGTTGSTLGATGNNSALPDGAPTVANGGASGWEVENPAGSLPPGAVPTSRVTLASSGVSDMFYFPPSGGGWVFSVGSITFGGSLYIDANLQKVVKNMLAKCGI